MRRGRSNERRVIVLGSTGSVGQQTLAVIEHLRSLEGGTELRVVGLAGGRKVSRLREQAASVGLGPEALAAVEPKAEGVRFRGPDAAEHLVRATEADLVVAAVVGAAGLPATLAAIELGRDVALANKETLVAGGALVVPLARERGVKLLPLDSEHAALWLCLQSVSPGCFPPCSSPSVVRRAILTASGGPFRGWSAARIAEATPEDALAHPTWSMGPKITVDCATLMNKALELIEAHWLFGLEASRLSAIVHPQSVVHAMAELVDGSVVAQMGVPDMRTPIQQALTWPERAPACVDRLELEKLSGLEFEALDEEKFPAFGLARRVIELGGTAGAVASAANEAAVAAFLEKRIGVLRIAELADAAIDAVGVSAARSLGDVLEADAAGRAYVADQVGASVSGGRR